VVDCGSHPAATRSTQMTWQSQPAPSWAQLAGTAQPGSSGAALAQVASVDSTYSGDNSDVPSAFQQVQSRAEDIMCLRSSRGYVTRQQLPISVPAQSQSQAHSSSSSSSRRRGAPAGGQDGPARETQKELVEKLLYLAVQQINSVKAGPPESGEAPGMKGLGSSGGSDPWVGGGGSSSSHRSGGSKAMGFAASAEAAAGPSSSSSRQPRRRSWDELGDIPRTSAAPSDHSAATFGIDAGKAAGHDSSDLPPPSNPNVEGTPRKTPFFAGPG